MKASAVDEIETPVMVRPCDACAVTESAGEHPRQFPGWQEEPRAATADVCSTLVPVDAQVMPGVISPQPSQSGTDRPDWTAPLYRYTSKISRQVLRFFKRCFLEPASPTLYDTQLRPLLMAYL